MDQNDENKIYKYFSLNPKMFHFLIKFLKIMFEIIIILWSPKFRHLKISCQHPAVHWRVFHSVVWRPEFLAIGKKNILKSFTL